MMLAGLAVLPVLGLLAWLAARRRARVLIAFAGLLSGFLPRRRPSRLYGLCVWLGLTCLVPGMAGPRWGRDWTQSAAPGRDLVVVLDLSRSMYAEAPTRVKRACDALLHLGGELERRGGHR